MTNERLAEMVERSATQVKRGFPSVSRDDIVQEIWIWALSHPRKVNEWIDGDRRAVGTLYTALRRAGSAFATRERAAQVGYEAEDLFYYSVAQLRELLPIVMDRENWYLQGQQEKVGKSVADPALGNTRLAMICDVRSSLEAGSEADKELLWTVFGLQDDTLADRMGITPEALDKRVVRALKRVQKRLGGPSPFKEYEGGRRAISNAQAQAITQNQENPNE